MVVRLGGRGLLRPEEYLPTRQRRLAARALRHPDVSVVIDLSKVSHQEKIEYVGAASHTTFDKRHDMVWAPGKTAGIAVGSYEAAALAYKRGYRYIAFGNLFFDGFHGLRANLAKLKELEG